MCRFTADLSWKRDQAEDSSLFSRELREFSAQKCVLVHWTCCRPPATRSSDCQHVYTSFCGDNLHYGNKNNLRRIEAQVVQKPKNNKPQSKSTGSHIEKNVHFSCMLADMLPAGLLTTAHTTLTVMLKHFKNIWSWSPQII